MLFKLEDALNNKTFNEYLDNYKIGNCYNCLTIIDRSIFLKELIACGQDGIDAVNKWFDENLYLKVNPSDLDLTSFSHTILLKRTKAVLTINKLLSIIYLNSIGDGYIGNYEFILKDVDDQKMEHINLVELDILIEGYSSEDAIGEGVISIRLEDSTNEGRMEFSNEVVYTNMIELGTGIVKSKTFIEIGSVVLTDFINALYKQARRKLDQFIEDQENN